MQLISRLEQARKLDPIVAVGQRAARLIRPGRVRDGLNGVWLGHPLHPLLAQAAVGAWLSASIVDLAAGNAVAVGLYGASLPVRAPASGEPPGAKPSSLPAPFLPC